MQYEEDGTVSFDLCCYSVVAVDWHPKHDITLDVGPTKEDMVLLYGWMAEHAATTEEKNHYLNEAALLKEKNDAARGD